MQTLATAVALPVSVGLVVLLVWNTLLLLRNQTTIEYHEGAATTLKLLPCHHTISACCTHCACPPVMREPCLVLLCAAVLLPHP